METVIATDKGTIEYGAAWELQKELFAAVSDARKEGSEIMHHLLLCEHPHVYTLGKSGVEENLLVNPEFLKSIGATYFRTDRGGDITYHGYGQLVGYPILDLERLGLGLKEYVHLLEETVIDTVAEYGIDAGRLEGATGVWIEPETARARKICAIGVKASRFVTMHGFALNVSTDMGYFSHINPCGFIDKGVTSIVKEMGSDPGMEDVKRVYKVHFQEVFKCKIK